MLIITLEKLNKIITDYSLKPISDNEIPYLKEYLYKALFVPLGSQPYPKSIIVEPFIKPIYENWGKDGDIGFVALDNSKIPIGMAWVRLYDNVNLPFGIIDATIPALTISIDENYRKMGIGSALMETLIDSAKEHGFKGISLSVDRRNYALKLYKKFGFRLYLEHKEYNPLYLLEF